MLIYLGIMHESPATRIRRLISRRRILQTLNNRLTSDSLSDLSALRKERKGLTVFPLPLCPTITVTGE
jgi:hypothetical protein